MDVKMADMSGSMYSRSSEMKDVDKDETLE